MELEQPYGLDPRVSVRPEEFGALMYHFGNRRLSFLRSPDMLRVLEQLDSEPTLEGALEAAGVDRRRWPSFIEALESLEASEMVRART